MSIVIRLRRDNASDWIAANPVLADGEPGYENDTRKLKIGNGSARWVDLEYIASSTSNAFDEALQAHVDSSEPHPIYDDGPEGPSLFLRYMNAKV